MLKIISLFIGFLLFASNVYAQARIGTGNVKALYDENCAACHGKKMEGGASVSLADNKWIHGNDDVTLTRVITHGVAGTKMPAYGDILDSEQIRSLVVLVHEFGAIKKAATNTLPKTDKHGLAKTNLHSFKLEHIIDAPGILWGMDFLPDGSQLITQKDGKLWHVKNNKRHLVKGTPDVWHVGQGGLLDVQLHPEYKKNGWVYLAYAKKDKSRKAAMTAIARGKIINGKWSQNDVIFSFPEKTYISAGSHFGSRIVFKDGFLYFSVGDRGRMQMAQDITKPNGKIHRITPEGKIPKDNPFVDQPNAITSIWSLGNRNPQGLAFHPVTGALWETEHGPRGGDELNVIERGHNYGWPKVTFGINYNGKPISDQTHAEGITPPTTYWTPSIAIAGMDFYTGDLFPQWKNHLFVGGMSAQELYRIKTKDNKVIERELILKDEGRIRDVINGPDGKLYLLLNDRSTNTGKVVRLAPAS